MAAGVQGRRREDERKFTVTARREIGGPWGEGPVAGVDGRRCQKRR